MLGLGLAIGIGDGGGSSGGPLIPAANLILNPRADKLITIATGVSAWGDPITGSGLAQAAGANQPALIASGSLNGLPCVRMQASGSKYMLGTLASLYTGSTLFMGIVGVITSTTANPRIMSIYAAAAANDFDAGSMTVVTPTSTTQTIVDSAGTSKSTQTVASMATGLAGVWSARFDGSHSIVRMNGVDGSTVADTTAFSVARYTVGVGLQTSVFPTAAMTTLDVYEIFAYSAAPSLTALSAYTQARYGLAA